MVGVLLVAALIGAGWLFFGHNNEPRYQGKPVSYWFKEYYSPAQDTEPGSDSYQDAINALRAMGSNALPYLVNVAFSTNEDSPSRTNFYNMLAKLPDSWHLPQLITKAEIRNQALEAIREIGPSATDIFPLITNELRSTNAFQHSEAIIILTCVTNQFELVIPYLASSLHDSNADIRTIAILGLAEIGPKAGPALPDLMEIFQNAAPGDRINREVIFVLRRIGSNAAPAIPQLKEAFEKDTDFSERCRLAECLFEIDPGQTYAFDYLIGILTSNATPRQIGIAAERLGELGTNARVSIPALLYILKTTNCDAGSTGLVLGALQNLGASNNQILPMLELKIGFDSKELRECALREIPHFDPSGREAVAVLVDLILKHSTNERWAIDQLGRMGPRAREAIPVLKQEMNTTNTELSMTVKFALWSIDPKNEKK